MTEARTRPGRGRPLIARAGLAGTHIRQAARHALEAFFAHRSLQTAAGISYYALLSLFPIAILIAAGLALALGDDAARTRTVDLLLESIPLREGEGRLRLERLLETTAGNAGTFGVVGAAVLMLSASGLMGALRHGVNSAWGVEVRRPPLRGKALDVLLVFAVGIPVVLTLALALLGGLIDALDDRASELLGPSGSFLAPLFGAVPAFVSLLLALGVFTVLYRVLPAVESPVRDIWPGALVAALGYQGAKAGFGEFVESFGRFDAIYGSLGAVIALLIFLFIVASVFLLGAEVAAQWPAVRDGRYSEQEASEATRPLRERLRDLGRRLISGEGG